jgi:hypothetical protein
MNRTTTTIAIRTIKGATSLSLTTFGLMTLSLTKLGITTISVTIKNRDTQHRPERPARGKHSTILPIFVNNECK